MAGVAPDLVVGAYSALLATGDRSLNKEALKLSQEQLEVERDAYRAALEDLRLSRAAQQLAQASHSLDKQALGASLESLELDKEAVDFARRSLSLDLELRKVGKRSLAFERQSLLTAHTDLTRQREWRMVEEKTQQLKAISSLSALIAGFAMVVLVELSLPEETNPILLIVFAISTGGVVCLMSICMISTSLMLVYILNYRQITDEPFKRVWQDVCERDWERAFLSFKLGVPCFLASLSCLSWMKFSTNNSWADAVAAISVTVLASITMTIWAFYMSVKYQSRTRERDLEDEFEVQRMQKAVLTERGILEGIPNPDLKEKEKRKTKEGKLREKGQRAANGGRHSDAETISEDEVDPAGPGDVLPSDGEEPPSTARVTPGGTPTGPSGTPTGNPPAEEEGVMPRFGEDRDIDSDVEEDGADLWYDGEVPPRHSEEDGS